MKRTSAYMLIVPLMLTVFSADLLAGGDAAAGMEKSKTCVACHGANGEGVAKNTKISGLSIGKFKEAMVAYKTGTRKHAMMEMFAKKLSDADVADLAAYYVGK